MSEATFEMTVIRTECVIRSKCIMFFILPGMQATLSHLTILCGYIEYITPHSTYIIICIASVVIIILYGPSWCVNHIRVAIELYVELSCVHTRRNMLSSIPLKSRDIHCLVCLACSCMCRPYNTCVQYSSRRDICTSAFSLNRQI